MIKNASLEGRFFLLIIFSLLGNMIRSQENISSKTSIYMELLGNAAGLSVNYDRIIYEKKFIVSACIGAGMVPANLIRRGLNVPQEKGIQVYGLPVSCNISFGKKRHHAELGVGATYQKGMYGVGHDYSKTLFGVIRIGYRYQKANGGFFWKAGFTPFFRIKEYGKISVPFFVLPIAGIGFGYSI